jgi:chromosome segregation ATPase
LLDEINFLSSQLSEELRGVEREEEERKLEIEALETEKPEMQRAMEELSRRHHEMKLDMSQMAQECQDLKMELEEMRSREYELSRQLDKGRKTQLSWAQRRKGLPDRAQRLESTLKDLRGDIAKREEWMKLVEEDHEGTCEEWRRVNREIDRLKCGIIVKKEASKILQDVSEARESAEMLRNQNLKRLDDLDLLKEVLLAPADKALLTGDFLDRWKLDIGSEKLEQIVERARHCAPGLIESLREKYVSMRLKELVLSKRGDSGSDCYENRAEWGRRQWKDLARVTVEWDGNFIVNPSPCPYEWVT